MTIRAYLSGFVGNGLSPATAFRPALFDLAPGTVKDFCDGRSNRQGTAGVALVVADVSSAQHALLIADARITYLPFERSDGSVVPPDGTIGEVSQGNRTTLRGIADTHHIPIQGIGLGDTVREALRLFKRRFILRYLLGVDDWTELLDSLVSSIAAAKRQRIATRLQSLGFDTSAIQGSDTVREALRKLASQDAVRLLRTS